MAILAGILGLLLVIAAAYIVVLHMTHWLERQGGFTIRVIWEDESDF